MRILNSAVTIFGHQKFAFKSRRERAAGICTQQTLMKKRAMGAHFKMAEIKAKRKYGIGRQIIWLFMKKSSSKETTKVWRVFIRKHILVCNFKSDMVAIHYLLHLICHQIWILDWQALRISKLAWNWSFVQFCWAAALAVSQRFLKGLTAASFVQIRNGWLSFLHRRGKSKKKRRRTSRSKWLISTTTESQKQTLTICSCKKQANAPTRMKIRQKSPILSIMTLKAPLLERKGSQKMSQMTKTKRNWSIWKILS